MHVSDSLTPAAGENPWHAGNRYTLHFEDAAATHAWRFELGDNNDLRLVVHERSGQDQRAGEILIVSGQAMLTRGMDDLPEGHEIDAVDGPGLMLQLALELLWRVIPAGPDAVADTVSEHRASAGEALALGTLSAAASFPAPWRAAAQVRRTGESSLDFDVTLSHGAAAPAGALLAKGAPALATASSLVAPSRAKRLVTLGMSESSCRRTSSQRPRGCTTSAPGDGKALCR